MRGRALYLAGALACAVPGGALGTLPKGVVVEEVEAGSAAERAGIARGDLLLAWERSAFPPANPRPASGTLVSPFDVLDVEIEEAPRGPFRLSGRRRGMARTWEIPPGDWNLTVRPLLPAPLLQTYRNGRREIAAGRLDTGLAAWRQTAVALAARGEPEPAAWILRRTAEVQVDKGLWDAARATYEEALSTTQRHGSRALLQLQQDFAVLLRQRGELRRAIDLLHPPAGESLRRALVLNQLGRLSALQDDYQTAERRISEALALRERLAPGSVVVAQALGNLGIVEGHLGKLAAAEDLHRRALAIDQRLQPDSLEVANDLTNLGNLESGFGDPDAAVDFHRRALVLRRRIAPESLDVAQALQNVASSSTGDPTVAIELLQQSLALQERLRVSDFMKVLTLAGLGETALQQHNYALAERMLRRARAIQEATAPSTLDDALILGDLARVLREEGRLAEAEEDGRRDLQICRELAPGTEREAAALRNLAAIVRRAKRPEEARDLYERALGSLEAHWRRLGGSAQVRSTLVARYASYYQEAIDLLFELHQTTAAFHVGERYRARGFLTLLAERDLAFEAEIPADLERERRSANAEHDRLLGRLAGLSSVSSGGKEELQRQLADVRRRQDLLREKIRAASPRLAALRDPEPLDLAAAAKALDPGTLLLSYSIGEKRSYLFAVGPRPGNFTAFRIEAGEKALRDEVRRLRTLIEQGGAAGGRETVLRAGALLTARLLAPVAREIAAADRLLVLPDGPLHLLPFAALADPNAGGTPRFLVEAKPIHEAASATVFAELKKTRRPRSELRLTAFGDPVYPVLRAGGEAPEPALREVLRDGLRLDPLPGTRAEVGALRDLFPQHSRVFLGAEATEERAKALGREPSIVHFACHAFLDQRSPLDSGLVLTIPARPREGQDNGLLQAWEVFEQVHLDADLVTLSACGSALGKEAAGEGLLGLTRAFQYAGARTVLSSLWGVGDAGTAELMQRFYGYLKAGETKDQALRRAQVDLLRSNSDLSRPFSWAAFELVGDWQ